MKRVRAFFPQQLGQHRVLSKFFIFIYLIQKKWKWLHRFVCFSRSDRWIFSHFIATYEAEVEEKSSNFVLPSCLRGGQWVTHLGRWPQGGARRPRGQLVRGCASENAQLSAPDPGSPPPPRCSCLTFSHLSTSIGHPKSPTPLPQEALPSSCHLTFLGR